MPAATARAKISLTVDAKGEIVQNRTEVEVPVDKDNADSAVFVKMEGWDVPLELRVVAQVAPSDASCVVAGVGTLKQIEDRVLTPSIRAITRDVAGGTYEVTEAKVDENGRPMLDEDGKPIIVTVNRPTKVLDLINQRPLIESEIERRIRPEGRKVLRHHPRGAARRAGHPAGTARRGAARAARHPACQGVHPGAGRAAAARRLREGEGDGRSASRAGRIRDRRAALGADCAGGAQCRPGRPRQACRDRRRPEEADGACSGLDATVKLRQFELVLDTIARFANAHPEVFTAALANAQKFVPNVQVGAGGDGVAGMLMAILGQNL